MDLDVYRERVRRRQSRVDDKSGKHVHDNRSQRSWQRHHDGAIDQSNTGISIPVAHQSHNADARRQLRGDHYNHGELRDGKHELNMMPRAHTNIVGRAGERGQTMILVVFSMLALLAMAAIAIDVTTLYVARHEAQQAADAAALAGAKTFVTSGFTSGYVTATTAQTLASNAAQTAGQQLSISGSPITSSEITVVPDTSDQLNPYVSVTIARTSLQTYFARIWGVSTTGVRAKATAEAYNPSGQNAPIQLSAVKPFLLPNCKPNQLANTNNCTGANVYFIDPT